jgi:aryl-alcohol dehydrogenase-like predicted oxidoreductase
MPEEEAGRLLHGALDLGIRLIDTARSYGLSEERMGRHLSGRREEFVLSTKVGYGVPGLPDWTGPSVEAGVDLALRTLQVESLDIAHLHSCPLEILARGDVVEALSRSVEGGKVRAAAYSGEGEALAWAVSSGAFASVQTSVNVCDQDGLGSGLLTKAQERGLGVLAKRPLANAPWRFQARPSGDTARAAYWDRWQAMALDLGGIEPAEFAIRFTLSQPQVDAAIVGTGSIGNLRAALEAASRGPLPADLLEAARRAFREKGGGWEGQV